LRYQREIKALNEKHLNEWKEFQKKIEFQNKKKLFKTRKRRKGMRK